MGISREALCARVGVVEARGGLPPRPGSYLAQEVGGKAVDYSGWVFDL